MGPNSTTRNWCRKKVFTCYIKTDFIKVYFSVNTGNIFLFLSISFLALLRNQYSWESIKSTYHECMVWLEKSVTRVTDRYHEACLVMPNSDPE